MGEVNNIVNNLSKQKLLAYFVLLWAGTFFFSSISGFIYLGEWGFQNASGLDIAIDILWNLTELGAAAVLVLLGLKILNDKT